MAEKKPMIVIKKITVVQGGAHGGGWKVAFADFMTAMMAFFLVMWLLASSSASSKKAVAEYFSTPSVIEYNYQNYGVELTLEKLFLDLINEPLKTLAGFLEPADISPNIMGMGMKKVVMAFVAEQLGEIASNVEVKSDTLTFEIPDIQLFERGKSAPNANFVSVMEKLKVITAGAEDSDVTITSGVFIGAVKGNDQAQAKMIAAERAALVKKRTEATLESESTTVIARIQLRPGLPKSTELRTSSGFIRIEVKQKPVLPDGTKPRPLKDEVFGEPTADQSVYDNFVDQLTKKKQRQ